MDSGRSQPWLVEGAFAMATFAAGAVAAILLGTAGVVLGLAALFALGTFLGSRSGSGWVVQGVPGTAVGVLVLVVGLPLAQEIAIGGSATLGDVVLVVALVTLVIVGLLVPGALIGRGLKRGRPGLTAAGCLVPIVLALATGAILSSLRLPGA